MHRRTKGSDKQGRKSGGANRRKKGGKMKSEMVVKSGEAAPSNKATTLFTGASGVGQIHSFECTDDNDIKGSSTQRQLTNCDEIKGDGSDDDVSDEEDFSSGDERDGKKQRMEDRPKSKDQIDRRR